MKEIINHPTYGQILYDQSFWTGKRKITVNGVVAPAISKKEFVIDGKRALIKGSYYTGIKMYIESDIIELSPKPKWYELVLALIPFILVLTWGNIPAAFLIFPIVGGAIGGGLSALCSLTYLFFMKRANKTINKILIGLAGMAATIFALHIVALSMLSMMA